MYYFQEVINVDIAIKLNELL